jgi:hypothetical protein
MREHKNNIKLKMLSLISLGVIIFVISSSTVMGATTYQTTLTKGTDIYIVDRYDDVAWKATVNSTSTPNDWFKGNASIVDAQSKLTLKGYVFTTWNTYDVLTSIFMPEYFTTPEIYALLGLMNLQGYNETTINSNYNESFKLWYGIRSVWNFTNSEYEELPSHTDGVIVLQNPLDYKTILDDYNNLSATLNLFTQFLGYTFPTVTADQFLWQLVLNGLAIAEPQAEYLTELINEMGPENVTAIGTTLTFERYGVTDYTVEIEYGSKGIMSSFTVKDNSEIIIFRLISTNSDWIFFTILIIVCVSAGTIIAYMIVRSRKLKKR